jgi:hypothetical protein
LVKLLEKPDTREVFDQLRMVKSTTVGNLIGFMHVYNLRFAAATTPQQRMIYEKLWPVLDGTRDRVMSEAKIEGEAVQADHKHVGDFFNKLNLDDIDGKPNKDAPKPPKPHGE